MNKTQTVHDSSQNKMKYSKIFWGTKKNEACGSSVFIQTTMFSAMLTCLDMDHSHA